MLKNGLFKRFCRADGGLAYLEFALVLPVLMTLFLGGVEVSRYILINQKVDKTATTMSDLIAQATTMSTGELDQLMEAVQHLMEPYDFSQDGLIIVTSVRKPSGSSAQVRWQYSGGGTLSRTSLIGSQGGVATLPNSFTMVDGEDVIITEAFYEFSPVVNNAIVDEDDIYKVSISKPRLGALDTLN